MKADFRVFCDESCHLQNDGEDFMLLGALWCLEKEIPRLTKEIASIQDKFHKTAEIKWTKVSPKHVDFYLELLDFFFKESSLFFRVVVIPNKKNLDHNTFNRGSHDEFYYKMYYLLLKQIVEPPSTYHVFIDIKDSWSRAKTKKLKEVLRNGIHDFSGEIVKDVQSAHSHDIRIMQLADLFIGAVGYANRLRSGNSAKEEIVRHLEQRRGKKLTESSPLYSDVKFNILRWAPSATRQQ